MRAPVAVDHAALMAHAEAHRCDAGAMQATCPCGQAVAFMCDACGEPIFLATRNLLPWEWCVHAVEFWRKYGT